MAEFGESAECLVLLDRERVPHEVHPLAQGVAVMDAVVAEHPHLDGVQRGQHAHTSDDGVEPLRVEQCAVGCVVADHEQAGDHHAAEQPEWNEK